MARRPTRCLAAFLIGLALVGCSSPDVVSTRPTRTQSSTTTNAGTSTTSVPSAITTIGANGIGVDAEVTIPDGDGPFPVVVLVHGGGWVTGSPRIMEPLANHLNENGFLTVNTKYTLATSQRAGFPTAVDDVACAVRYAASHPEGDGTVALVGHSAGAHIGAVVALTGDRYGGGCPHPGGGMPTRFVGLAGPYDISRLAPALGSFFGGGPDQLEEEWRSGNPQLLADQNPELESLIMYGESDGLVPGSFAIAFHEALNLSGSDALLEMVEGARHNELHDPDLVGDLIVTWLER